MIVFCRFRAGVKDLEVMTQNLISSAFETVNTVEEGVMLLDVFQHLSARESVRRTIDKKTVEVGDRFCFSFFLVQKRIKKSD